MIPKIIHYCWYGKSNMPPLSQNCINSWRSHLADYEFIEWGEGNSPISSHKYMKKAYDDKMWAFVADYMRMLALYKYGGIYLDTDMEIIKNLDPLLDMNSFAGYESDGQVSAGLIACKAGDEFIKSCLNYMDAEAERGPLAYTSIPRIMQSILDKGDNKIDIFPTDYFYPYNPWDKKKNVKQLMYSDITKNTYAIHHWSASWVKPKTFLAYFKSAAKHAISNFPLRP